MDASETINELAAALAKAQGQIVPAKYDAQNPHLKNRYTTLAAVWDAIRKPLSDNGLAIAQIVTTEADGMYLLTRLMHSSGQYIQSVYPIAASDGRGISSAQAVGSALTYARRYSLTALVGVVSDDDDDGNSAGQAQTQRQTAKPKPVEQPKAAQPTNGKQAQQAQPAKPAPAQPSNGDALPFKDQGTAVKWAAQFAYYQKPDGSPDYGHITGSIKTTCKEHECAERDVACWGWPWYDRVMGHVALAAEESGDAGPAWAAIDAAGVDEPQFS
jgi:hypothetical protein